MVSPDAIMGSNDYASIKMKWQKQLGDGSVPHAVSFHEVDATQRSVTQITDEDWRLL